MSLLHLITKTITKAQNLHVKLFSLTPVHVYVVNGYGCPFLSFVIAAIHHSPASQPLWLGLGLLLT